MFHEQPVAKKGSTMKKSTKETLRGLLSPWKRLRPGPVDIWVLKLCDSIVKVDIEGTKREIDEFAADHADQIEELRRRLTNKTKTAALRHPAQSECARLALEYLDTKIRPKDA